MKKTKNYRVILLFLITLSCSSNAMDSKSRGLKMFDRGVATQVQKDREKANNLVARKIQKNAKKRKKQLKKLKKAKEKDEKKTEQNNHNTEQNKHNKSVSVGPIKMTKQEILGLGLTLSDLMEGKTRPDGGKNLTE